MMLSLLPVKKLSRHKISFPCSISRSQRFEPKKPAPPVTSIRFMSFYGIFFLILLFNGNLLLMSTRNIPLDFGQSKGSASCVFYAAE